VRIVLSYKGHSRSEVFLLNLELPPIIDLPDAVHHGRLVVPTVSYQLVWGLFQLNEWLVRSKREVAQEFCHNVFNVLYFIVGGG